MSRQGADLHVAQLMPLPLAVSCFYLPCFTFLMPADLDSPGQNREGHKTVVVPVVITMINLLFITVIIITKVYNTSMHS